MKSMAFLFLLLAASAAGASPNLDCKLGPANQTFGGTPWLVYACDDGHSVILLSAPGSPAAPFYFSFAYNGHDYELHGEGTGSQKATDAAYAELGKLGNAGIVGLYTAAVKAAGK
jgi:hypothetical protein